MTRGHEDRKPTPPSVAAVPAAPESPPAEPAVAAGFPIVGIGASAGGLAAFEAFFSGMPKDAESKMAFVLVQHLAPDHKSILSELVGRYTRMRVFEAQDGMIVKPNCAYIIPPNHDMAFLNGALQLLAPGAPRGQRLPIDFFFQSLAQDQHDRAICVVLSGTGSDGTQGLRAVKGEGGMAMAQEPASTEYDGMPRSAIATGLVDYVLPPAQMAAQLIDYAARTLVGAIGAPSSQLPKSEQALKKIFVLLRAQTGHDFSQYKQNTVSRRIERRMAVQQVEVLDAYVRLLQEKPAEVEALFRDLLIGVTQFFRDAEAFDALEEQIPQQLFAGKPAGATLRVWVPGCSTGEEAYSIAILIREQIEALKESFKLQLFATDVDSRAVEAARAGIYPASVCNSISPERLARFFSQARGGAYRINKNIRDLLIFSEQDVIQDPPFSKLDLISCRNLLIYLGPELQKRLIPLFHYALNPGGLLFLGNSETVGDFVNLFEPLDRKAKLYRRKREAQDARPAVGKLLPSSSEAEPFLAALDKPSGDIELLGDGRSSADGKLSGDGKLPARELTEAALLDAYAPVAVLVDERGDIGYIHGRTGEYLEPAPGEASMNILKMARQGLRPALTTTLREAVLQRELICMRGLKMKSHSGSLTLDLTVRPVSGVHGLDSRSFLVIFEERARATELTATAEQGSAASADESTPAPETDAEKRIAGLKQELRAQQEYLETTQEEMQSSNEELRSSNEEMQSINEELQSTNEELETSKEELQSVNEELATVNAELQSKVADLSQTSNDMANLLAGTGVGTIFVNHELRIQRFTPAVTQVINLIPSDVGQPVGHIVSNLVGYDRLVEDVQTVLRSLVPKQVEVQTLSGAWYSLRIQPYRTLENVIEGAVVTFFDISDLKQLQDAQRESATLQRLAVVTRDGRDAITLQDAEGQILAWNPAAEALYGWSEAEALAMNIRDLIPERLRAEAIARTRQLGRAELLEPYLTERVTKSGKLVKVRLTASAVLDSAGQPYAVATTERALNGGEP